MKTIQISVASLTMLVAFPATCFGQNGTDINQAIPVYFGQTINDIGDVQTAPVKVYSVALSKGQRISATLTSPQEAFELTLWSLAKLTVAGETYLGESRATGPIISNFGASGTQLQGDLAVRLAVEVEIIQKLAVPEAAATKPADSLDVACRLCGAANRGCSRLSDGFPSAATIL